MAVIIHKAGGGEEGGRCRKRAAAKKATAVTGRSGKWLRRQPLREAGGGRDGGRPLHKQRPEAGGLDTGLNPSLHEGNHTSFEPR